MPAECDKIIEEHTKKRRVREKIFRENLPLSSRIENIDETYMETHALTCNTQGNT
jgi:hypothetical protein